MQGYAQVIASSLKGLDQEYLSITQNLANASTVGYKLRRNAFAQVLSASQDNSVTGNYGSVETSAVVDFSQGGLNQTNRPLDLALAGDGFFVVETPEGNLYTRNGTFRLNENRQLVDTAGRIVSGQGGAITVPASASTLNIQVSKDGNISAADQVIGKLKLVKFEKPQELDPYGGNYFRAPAGMQSQAADDLAVHQGFQESSNVKVVEELVNLIMVTRIYEANIKGISSQEEQANSILQVAMA